MNREKDVTQMIKDVIDVSETQDDKKKEEAWGAYSKTQEANRVHCMADCQPKTEADKETAAAEKARAEAWQAQMQKREEAWDAYSKTPEANRVHCMADCQPKTEVNKEGDDAEPPAVFNVALLPADSKAENDECSSEEENQDSFMSQWTKRVLHYFHPRAVVKWEEYAKTRWTRETLDAIIEVAKMLEELEGKSIEECKEELDSSVKYGAGMNWARHFVLKFVDTRHAMTIHEFTSFTPLLCTVRLSKSRV